MIICCINILLIPYKQKFKSKMSYLKHPKLYIRILKKTQYYIQIYAFKLQTYNTFVNT